VDRLPFAGIHAMREVPTVRDMQIGLLLHHRFPPGVRYGPSEREKPEVLVVSFLWPAIVRHCCETKRKGDAMSWRLPAHVRNQWVTPIRAIGGDFWVEEGRTFDESCCTSHVQSRHLTHMRQRLVEVADEIAPIL
jgi:hypothetical protein